MLKIGAFVLMLTVVFVISVPSYSASPPPFGTFDWRNYNGGNYVTGIRDQGNCQACWAFSSTAALESVTINSLSTPGIDLDISEQVVDSCDINDWAVMLGGCENGFFVKDFFKNTGTPLESCYGYVGANTAYCNGAVLFFACCNQANKRKKRNLEDGSARFFINKRMDALIFLWF